MRVYLSHADGMQARGGGAITGFEIAGADGKYVPAEVKVDGNTLLVTSAAGGESGGGALRVGGRSGVQSDQSGGPAGEPVP